MSLSRAGWWLGAVLLLGGCGVPEAAAPSTDGSSGGGPSLSTAPTVAAVVITKDAITVAPGGSRQMTALGRMSDGTWQTIGIAWSATGGSISGTGLYTGGQLPGVFRIIAKEAAGPLADTSAALVGLSAVELTPAQVSLKPGQAQQFAANGRFVNGTLQPVPVTWSATGGTISPTGLYTAGAVAGTYRVIATLVDGVQADTSAVTISSTATLTAVELLPGAVTVATGQTQQFSARGRLSDGTTTPVSVTWSATGGTINSTGLYTAGTSTGTYSVIATLLGGTMADTSQVSLVPPSQAGANEPPGFVLISDRFFSAKVEAGWADRGDTTFSIIPDATAPKSPTSVGQALFPAGMVGGGGPINTYLQSSLQAGKTELYSQFWFKLSPNFVGAASNGVNKVLHYWTGQTSKVVFAAWGYGSDDLVPQMRLQNIDIGTISFNLDPNVNRPKLQRGQWYRIEVLLRLNTPGVQDGEIHWWVNGSKVGQYTNIGYNAPGRRHEWWVVGWAPTYGGPADIVPANQYMWMDHFYVSGK